MQNVKIISFIALSVLFLSTGCKSSDNKNQLIIFHAGSLTVPIKQIIESFNNEYPDVKIYSESAGSVASARKITDLKRQCDVFLSADYNVINKYLIPDYADWNIHFAANEMVLAFHSASTMANEINSNNWMEVIMINDVRFGRSDPNSDPCGYRTLLTMELAERFYHKDGLLDRFVKKDTRFIRPKETDLIALLETNTIDYFFIYRSVAVQHNLPYILFPDSINLKSPELKAWYENATVQINGKRPGEKKTLRGEPMIYGLTIPNNASNPEMALDFVAFLLNDQKGMAILEKNGQPSLVPAPARNYDKIPDRLKHFSMPGHSFEK